MSDGYDPTKSRIGDDKLADFLRAPLTGDICEIPGIGPAAQKNLASGDEHDQVHNTYQLIGKFLMLKTNADDDGTPVSCQQHCDKFWFWLKSKGIVSYRSGIVMAIAEKMNTMLPGIYDASEFS